MAILSPPFGRKILTTMPYYPILHPSALSPFIPPLTTFLQVMSERVLLRTTIEGDFTHLILSFYTFIV
jgi:hypothetical protein